MGLAEHTRCWELVVAFPADENDAVGLGMAAGEDEVVDWRRCALQLKSFQTTANICVCVFGWVIWAVNISFGVSRLFCI